VGVGDRLADLEERLEQAAEGDLLGRPGVVGGDRLGQGQALDEAQG
jgi:hypothetical protein